MEAKDEKWIEHYCSSHKILLVGEGDFSFAVCLAKAFGSAVNMVATSLDSEGELMSKYTAAGDNVKMLKEMGCSVLHEVNAGTMAVHPRLYLKFFDRIVFNFPHAGFLYGSESSPSQIERHKQLVKEFLRNAQGMVSKDGEVHVTHKTAHPFSSWGIEKLALDVGLRLKDEVGFMIYKYPGYENKKGDGYLCNGSFPVGACSTFKFVKA